MKKYIVCIGLATYLALIVLSLIFWLERTAFLDISFHLFHILKDKYFAIQNYRFGAFITQIPILLCYSLNCSLKTIMMYYSLGFEVYYFITFIIILFLFKSIRFALLLLFYNTLMVSDTFYWIQSELQQGLALLILYFSLIYSIEYNKIRTPKYIIYPVLGALVFTIAFMHPLLFFPFLYLSIYLYIDNDRIRTYILGSGLYYFIMIAIKFVFFNTSYESTSLSGLKNLYVLFPDYIYLESNVQFLKNIPSKYHFLVFLLIVVLIWHLKRNNYLKVLIVLFFFVGYILLINISFPKGAEEFYIENMYLPLILFVATPIALDFYPLLNNKPRITALMLAMLVSISLYRIYNTHKIYTARIELLQRFLDRTGKTPKMIISERHFPMDTLMMSWATPYEIWLLSTISSDSTRCVMITDNVKSMHHAKNLRWHFVTRWGVYEYSTLPKKYFKFRDTLPYVIVE